MDEFESLQGVPWNVLGRTYGNAHNTMIGLLVQWWVAQGTVANWAMEAPPGCTTSAGERIHCDALLGTAGLVVGAVEVEGLKQTRTAGKLGQYFVSTNEHWAGLRFAILMLYPTGPRAKKAFARASDETIEIVRRTSDEFPERDLILLDVEKKWDAAAAGIRTAHRNYYRGSVVAVHACGY